MIYWISGAFRSRGDYNVRIILVEKNGRHTPATRSYELKTRELFCPNGELECAVHPVIWRTDGRFRRDGK
jgi:hypothetical protein